MSSSDEHTTRASDESLASARPSDTSSVAQRPSGRASTIIVDPELMEEARRLSERPPAAEAAPPAAAAARAGREARTITTAGIAPAPSADMQAQGDVAREDDAHEEGADVPLSAAEADRLAESFRPSWEPPTPIAIQAPEPSTAVMPQSAPEARPVLISEVPGARPRSGLLMAGGAVLSFVALAVLGWAMTLSDAPPDKARAGAPQESSAPAPSAPPKQIAPERPRAPAAAPALPEPTPHSPELAAAAAPAIPAPTPVATPEPTPPPVEPEPEPMLVALRITTSPREAKLVLDGAAVPNPYDAMLPKGERYELEASAPGYQGRTLTIDLERERRVALELERERRAAPRAEPAPAKAVAPPKRKRSRPARATVEPKKGAAFVEESPY
jgi:hypothetical protein